MRLTSNNQNLSSPIFKDVFKLSPITKTKRDAIPKLLNPRQKRKKALKLPKQIQLPEDRDESFTPFYDKASRTYRRKFIGEIKLHKFEFYLMEPDKTPSRNLCKSPLLPSITPESRVELLNFIRSSRMPLTLGLNRKLYSSKEEVKDEAVIQDEPFSRQHSSTFLKACKSTLEVNKAKSSLFT